MKRLGIILTMAVALVFIVATYASAEHVTLPHEDAVEWLENRYGETSVAAGIDKDGNLVELFTTPEGNTWTMLLTEPNGLSRIISAGKSWLNKNTGTSPGAGPDLCDSSVTVVNLGTHAFHCGEHI